MKGMKLKDKVAVITGGNSGIGKAAAILFAKEGARVCITGRNEKRCEEVVKEITDGGGQAIYTIADVRSSYECQRTVNQTLKAFQRLDILFNNAGVYFPNTALDCSEDEWDLTNAADLAEAESYNQERLKENGDWIIFPKTIEYIARGRFGQDESGLLYYNGEPIPKGLRLENCLC